MISKISQVIAAPAQPTRQPTSPPVHSATTQAMAKDAVQAAAANNAAAGGSAKALAAAVDQLNASVQNLNRNLEFSIDKSSGNVLVKVVDSETHEVIRQIPGDQALALAQSLKEYEQDHERHIGLLQTEA